MMINDATLDVRCNVNSKRCCLNLAYFPLCNGNVTMLPSAGLFTNTNPKLYFPAYITVNCLRSDGDLNYKDWPSNARLRPTATT